MTKEYTKHDEILKKLLLIYVNLTKIKQWVILLENMVLLELASLTGEKIWNYYYFYWRSYY